MAWRALLFWALTAVGVGCNTLSGIHDYEFGSGGAGGQAADDVTCAFYLEDTVENTAVMGGIGGEAFEDPCPPDEVLVGFSGGLIRGLSGDTEFSVQLLSGLTAICGVVALSSGDPYEVVITPGESAPAHGAAPSSVTEATCLPDGVVVGFEGQTHTEFGGTYMTSLSLHCAPLVVGGSADAPEISFGEATNTVAIGDVRDDGDNIPPTDCPEGQVAAVSRGQAGSWVDGFGLGCVAPAIGCDGE